MRVAFDSRGWLFRQLLQGENTKDKVCRKHSASGMDSRWAFLSQSKGGSFFVGCRAHSGQRRSISRERQALPREDPGFGSHHPKVVDSTLVEEGLVRGAEIYWKDSAALKLRRRARLAWDVGGPKRVLVVKKPDVEEATSALRCIVSWLRARGLEPLVEQVVHRSECEDVAPFESGEDVDFCITLGGDGTVLHLASLFVKDVPLPPVLSFAMGTLGFLTPFDFKDYDEQLTRVLAADQTVGCTLRSRKRCEVYTTEGKLLGVHHVLNECIIDRGHSASTLTLEIFVDGQYITTVTADGVIIATPSGSTAYSMTAGGPMVAPSVPCTLITPVAPLSLSFRPLVLPETSDVIMHVAEHSKSKARACFDGKQQARLVKGSAVHLTASLYPLPMITMGRLDSDWYEGITQKLKWNASIVEPPSRPKGVPNGLSNGSGVYTT